MESLAGGCGTGKPGALDEPSGRVMGDTTTLYVVEVAEWWHLAGDTAELVGKWPSVQRAVTWLLGNAASTGLPRYLQTTYDHFGFDKRETVAYNAFVYMAALSAANEMAAYLRDNSTAQATAAALTRARSAVVSILWNTTDSYFRAYDGGNAVFTDSLYGLMVSHAHGFGLQVGENKKKKLCKRWK